MTRRQFGTLPLSAAASPAGGVGPGPERALEFHRQHPLCDMLGLNLTHPRFLVDNIDLGKRNEDTCREDESYFCFFGADPARQEPRGVE